MRHSQRYFATLAATSCDTCSDILRQTISREYKYINGFAGIGNGVSYKRLSKSFTAALPMLDAGRALRYYADETRAIPPEIFTLAAYRYHLHPDVSGIMTHHKNEQTGNAAWGRGKTPTGPRRRVPPYQRRFTHRGDTPHSDKGAFLPCQRRNTPAMIFHNGG